MEDSIQMLKDSFDLIEYTEANLSGDSGHSLSIDRIHLSINLSLKLLWCNSMMMMPKEE